jgi:hypothetical protein
MGFWRRFAARGDADAESLPALRFVCFGVALIIGLALLLVGDAFAGDSTSYLDMGDAFFQGHWKAILNTLWSPLYPLLIGLARWIAKPSMQWQPLVVNLTNLLIYVLTLSAFHYFWSRLLRIYRTDSKIAGAGTFASFSDLQFWALGYAVFLLIYLDGITNISPDLLLSAIVFFCCGLILTTHLNGPTAYRFSALGILLGAGFLTKAIMLPLAPFFLASAIGAARPRRVAVQLPLVTLFFFVIITGPYVLALSHVNRRFTVGDAGPLNYLWHVNRVPFVPYTGSIDALALGKPRFPIHQLWKAPDAYEYEAVSGVTYSPWYDPGKLMSGLHVHLSWKEQFATVSTNLRTLLGWLWDQRALAGGILVLLGVGPPWRTTFREFLSKWFVWLPAAAALSLYLLTSIEYRYLAQFMMVFWGTTFLLVRVPGENKGERFVTAGFVVMLLMLTIHLAHDFADDVGRRRLVKTQMQIAERLSANGVRPGDRVAVVDANLGDEWQKLLNLSVVAEIPYDQQNKFWSLAPEERAAIFQALARSGAKVLVAPTAPDWAPTTGWIKVADAGAYMLRLSP